MREFYLENQSGSKYFFNFKNQTLVSEPSGLGFEKTNTYIKFGKTYKKVKEEIEITLINMTLYFLKGYAGYNEFLSFLKETSKLKLFYKAKDTKYCYVDIPSLSKTELVAGTVKSDIVFDKLSLWQKDITTSIEVEETQGGKVYPFTYSYKYSLAYQGKVRVENNGTDKAPLRIEITGDVNLPEVVITKDGEVVSKLKLYVEATNALIVIDANEINQSMIMTSNGEVIDIYEYQDFTSDNFLFLDIGNYEIEFKPGVSSNTSCKITYTERYISN